MEYGMEYGMEYFFVQTKLTRKQNNMVNSYTIHVHLYTTN